MDFTIYTSTLSVNMSSEIDPLVHTDEPQERPNMCDKRVRHWFFRMLLITIIFSVLFGLLIQIWMYYQSLSDDLDTDNVGLVGYALFCNNTFIKGWNVRQCHIEPGFIQCNVQSNEQVELILQPPQIPLYNFQNNTLIVNQTLSSSCTQWMLYALPI